MAVSCGSLTLPLGEFSVLLLGIFLKNDQGRCAVCGGLNSALKSERCVRKLRKEKMKKDRTRADSILIKSVSSKHKRAHQEPFYISSLYATDCCTPSSLGV